MISAQTFQSGYVSLYVAVARTEISVLAPTPARPPTPA